MSPVIIFALGVLMGCVIVAVAVRPMFTLYRTQLNEAEAQKARLISLTTRNPAATAAILLPQPTQPEPDPGEWMHDDFGLASSRVGD